MLQEANKLLKQYFGYDTFRPLQAEVISVVLAGNDALVLMPTGGGKSLCFQIPALVKEGTAIVVSPLISLMKDQVDSLLQNGIAAAFLNSSQALEEQYVIEQKVLAGAIKILYVSPERAVSEAFFQFLSHINVSLFAIDEAHCISAWGHDFRPEYAQLQFIKKQYPEAPLLALTATADKLTRADILQQLDLENARIFIDSFNRANLSLQVEQGRNRFQKLLQFIQKHPKQSGIVYCLSRKTCESLAAKLDKKGIAAAFYHAGMSAQERELIQNNFIRDQIPIICATVAFGMGIDKSNVRWVVHYNLPKNIESFYQEIGRAGRDGLPSDTLLFYSYADVVQWREMINNTSAQPEVQLTRLERMQHYAEAAICRRQILLQYFNETLAEPCNNCDVCKNPPEIFDGTILAQKILSAVARTNQTANIQMVVDILRASAKKELIARNFHTLKTYGVGRDIATADWFWYIEQLLQKGFLDIAYQEHNNLKLTPKSIAFLQEKQQMPLVSAEVGKSVEQETTATPSQRLRQETTGVRDALFEKLRLLRKDIADENNVPPYIIFNDKTLEQMAATRPLSEEEMSELSGVGEYKLQKYGKRFIKLILQHIYEENKK
ncbi:MAG: DNA helicase RecQ [Chitinophagales bacterium]|nr:DNA helicase RecQ [Bacteroidota bacterium]MCB9043887.1 DNA helicase RecQ [Chitinophagales bacterium]